MNICRLVFVQVNPFLIIFTGLEDASKIMPSSGTEVTKEHHKEKRKSNKKSSRRSSKVMDLNKV